MARRIIADDQAANPPVAPLWSECLDMDDPEQHVAANDDDLGPARGVFLGIVLGAPFWLIVAFIGWTAWCWFRD